MGEVIYLRPEYKPRQLDPVETVVAAQAECQELRDEFKQPNSYVTAEDVSAAEQDLYEALGELTNDQLQEAWQRMNQPDNGDAA